MISQESINLIREMIRPLNQRGCFREGEYEEAIEALKATQFKEGLTPCLIDQGEAAKILKVDKVSIFRFAESKQLDRHYIPSPTGGRNIVRFRLEQVLSLAGFSDTEINKIVSERLNK